MLWDVLVIGSGAAGLRAAIAANLNELKVCVISKGPPGMGTSTALSYGIFAAALDGGSLEEHKEQTLMAGRGINDKELVNILVDEGPTRILELLDWGINAVSKKNNFYVKGRPLAWGKGIVNCLLDRARSLGTHFLGGVEVWKVKMVDGIAQVLAYSKVRRNWIGLSSRSIIMATGGAGALFLRHDNPQRILGGGYALALEAGAVLQDMEFVQFHPAGLAEPTCPPVLIPSAVVDFGFLTNSRGEDLLEKYGINNKSAAKQARDKVSQAISQEIIQERQDVYLDLRSVSKEQWEENPSSSGIREILLNRYGGSKRPLRVAPVAHHVMGGIRIDSRGTSSVPGLFAAGEVTGGLHGANRMRGNALTEALVFGARAGAAAAEWANNQRSMSRKTSLKYLSSFLPGFHAGNNLLDGKTLKVSLRQILWEHAGTIRNRQGLLHAQDQVTSILEDAYRLSPGNDHLEIQRIMELQLGARTALLIIKAALLREESRGSHFREDFPEQNDECWLGHITIRRTQEGDESCSFKGLAAR